MGRRSAWAGSVAAAVVALAACGDGDTGTAPCEDDGVASVSVETQGGNTLFRIGEGLALRVVAEDGCGDAVQIPSTAWSTTDSSVLHVRPIRIVSGDDVTDDPDEGWVEARGFGTADVLAEVAGVVGRLTVEVTRPETRAEGMEVLGVFTVPRSVTDLWAYGDYVYGGTNVGRCGPGTVRCESIPGSLLVWRLGADGVPISADSVALPGSKTNDVKVSPDGDYLVVSQEISSSNGIVVLSLDDPGRPSVLRVYTADLEGGVHNLWLERIDGTDYAFVAEDGNGAEERLHVVDLSDPASPRTVARWSGGPSSIHDVYVRDGLAFVSHWDDGLVILDVGNGMAGGDPTNPVEVGRVVMQGGNTHNAWYWPEGAVVFVGEETFPHAGNDGDVGELHVIDVSDLTNPVEIASYRIDDTTPHNFWMDEERAILYAGWYGRGVRALDVSGTLAGDLSSREIAFVEPSGPRGLGSIWAPQLHRGVVYLADQVHGLWAVTPAP